MPTKTLTVFFCAIALTLWFACHKSGGSSNSQNYYNVPITGIAYIKTGYIDTSTTIILGNKPIYIDTTLGADTSSHFFSVTTRFDGTFTFYVSDTNRQYRIFTSCYDTSSSTFIPLYYGAQLTNHPYASNPVYTITATINTLTGAGMIIRTVDTLGNGIPRVNVLLYISPGVANKDSTYSGKETFRQVLTDSLGKAYSFFATLPFDSLYESTKVMISPQDSLVLFDSAIAIPQKGIFYNNLILH